MERLIQQLMEINAILERSVERMEKSNQQNEQIIEILGLKGIENELPR